MDCSLILLLTPFIIIIIIIVIKFLMHKVTPMWIWGVDSQPPGEDPLNCPNPWKTRKNSEFWVSVWRKVENFGYKETEVAVDSMHESPYLFSIMA